MCTPNPARIFLYDTTDGHAINFALAHLEPWEVAEFLSDYRKGDLKPYPEFVDYLARIEIESLP